MKTNTISPPERYRVKQIRDQASGQDEHRRYARSHAGLNAPSTFRYRSTIVFFLLAVCGCSKFELLNATIPRWGSTKMAGVAYGPLHWQTLDVYRPHDVAVPMPVVIFFHGGDWQDGTKEDYRFVAQSLTSRGFVAVLPDFRPYPDVQFPAFVQDGALAVRWVHDHADQIGGDVNRIYLMGHSSGAHIAAMLTMDPEYLRDVGLNRHVVRATAGLSGPYNFVPPPGDAGAFNQMAADRHVDSRFEPISFVDGKEPPMLLVQGLKDQTVMPQNTFDLAERIRSAGGEVKVITYSDRAHVGVVLSLAWPFRFLAPTLRDVTDFFHSH